MLYVNVMLYVNYISIRIEKETEAQIETHPGSESDRNRNKTQDLILPS